MGTMRNVGAWVLAGALGLAGGRAALAAETPSGSANEPAQSGQAHHRVTIADLPQAVRDTLHREARGGKVEELRRETRKDGSTVYEADIVKGGRGTCIKINPDGRVVERGKAHEQK
jgi:hypothetical protein